MANYFDQFDDDAPAEQVRRPAPVMPAARGNFFDQFDEPVPLGDPGSTLRRPDGSLTEAGWETEKQSVAQREEQSWDERSFLQNLAAGFGRSAPKMWRGVKQIGVDAIGHVAGGGTIGPQALLENLLPAERNLSDLITGQEPERRPLFENAVTRWADRTGEGLMREEAQERRDTSELMSTGGGVVGGILGDFAVTAPLGAVAAPVRGASAVSAIPQMATLGAVEGALAPVAGEGERLSNMALGAGMAGGLTAVGRGVMSASENALPSNLVARGVNFFNSRANRTGFADEGEALAQRTGINLSPGAISGSRAQTGIENMSRQSVFSADRAFEADQQTAQQAINYVNGVMSRMSPDVVSKVGVGGSIQKSVRDAVQKITSSREDVAAKQFGAIRRMVGDAPVVKYSNLESELNKIAGEYTDVIGGDANRIRTQIRNLLGEIQGKNGFSLDAARKARSFYGRAAARSADVFDNVNPDVNATLARRLYAAMSRDIESAAERIDEAAGFGRNMPVPDGVTTMKPSEMLKQANDDYRRHSQLLEAVENSPLRRLIGDEISVEDFMTVNKLPPETVVARLRSMAPTEIHFTRDFLERSAPETWQQYKRLMLQDALESANTLPTSAGARHVPFNAANFVKALGGDKPDRIEQMRAIFSPGELAEVQDAIQAARRMGDKFGANFSGTGPYNEIAGSFRDMTMRGLATVGSTAVGFNNVARMLTDAGGRKALIELARLPPGTRKANDLAAYLATVAAGTVNEPPALEIDVVGGTPGEAVSEQELERLRARSRAPE